MIMGCLFGAIALALTAWVQPVAAQDVEKPAGTAAPAVAEATATMPAMPRVRLAPMPGFDDETAYVRSMSDRPAALADLAQKTDLAGARVELWISAANLILAYQIEPNCTRRVLHLADGENELDVAALTEALDRADGFLAQAGVEIDDLARGEDAPDEKLTQWRHESSTLKAFSAALRAYLIPAEKGEADRAARRAASGLSPLREDSNRQVAAAASFWQACLRSRESDFGPALSALDLALADLRPESMPYVFFARLLRCRLVGDRGSPATALALLLQFEERSREWIEDETARADAVRTTRLVCLQTLARWFDRLSAEDATAERRWCVERMKTIIGESFNEEVTGGEGATVLRLTPSVPLVAVVPERDQIGTTSTQPSADNP